MEQHRAAPKAAFPHTVPVLTGYLVLGFAYGVLIAEKGYPVWAAALTSIFIFAGSMQFVAVGLLGMGFAPLGACLMTLMVNARHLFYGISMLKKFEGTGKFRPYLIFGLTDETFSILCDTDSPEGVDRARFMFWITLLDHSYWVLGTTLGAAFGSLVSFNTAGMDFVLTALFVTILIGQWRGAKNHLPALVGLGASVLCRLLFGRDFIIPAMAAILLLVTLLKKPMERGESA